MPKVKTKSVMDIVLNIREYFVQEKYFQGPIIPLEKVNERVATATGLSLRTVARILKDARLIQSGKIIDPKKRKVRKDKLFLDIDVLRQTIKDFYKRKEVPTVKRLHQVLQEEAGFKGSREIVRQHIKLIGLNFDKKRNKKPPEIVTEHTNNVIVKDDFFTDDNNIYIVEVGDQNVESIVEVETEIPTEEVVIETMPYVPTSYVSSSGEKWWKADAVEGQGGGSSGYS